jgi:hypothetical protein
MLDTFWKGADGWCWSGKPTYLKDIDATDRCRKNIDNFLD